MNQRAQQSSDFSDFSGAKNETLFEPPRPLLRDLPPAKTYPTDALGRIMAGTVAAIHDKTQAAIGLCAQSVMATCALAAQAHHNVELPTGQRRPISLFAVSVAESGDRNSSADELATRPVAEREAILRAEYECDVVGYENDLMAWKKTQEKLLTDRKGNRESIRDALTGSMVRLIIPPVRLVRRPEHVRCNGRAI